MFNGGQMTWHCECMVWYEDMRARDKELFERIRRLDLDSRSVRKNAPDDWIEASTE